MDISNYNIEQCDAPSVLAAVLDAHDHPQKIDQIAAAISPIAAAAAAYSEGKPQLAQAITAKGVTTAADASLATMAQNVGAIQQETITIDGGEMYAKQLYGVKDNSIVPGYWNLYEVMAYLLSKTSTGQYSILLCEFPKGDAQYIFSTAVSAGSIPVGYVFSDDWQINGEGSLNIHANTESGHMWNDDLDMKGNRWVAWLFEQVMEGATAPTVSLGAAATNCPQPRSIHIGRHMGTITVLANGNLIDIVATDGNILNDVNVGTYTQQWSKHFVIRNLQNQTHQLLNNPTSNFVYIHAKKIAGGDIIKGTGFSSLIVEADEISGENGMARYSNQSYTKFPYAYIKSEKISGTLFNTGTGSGSSDVGPVVLEIQSEEIIRTGSYGTLNWIGALKKLILKYMPNGNDYQRTISFERTDSALTRLVDIDLQDGWLKPLRIDSLTNVLTAENIALHMLDRLGTCTAETGQLTLKLGQTNLTTIQNDSTYSSYLTEATTTKGWAVIA